MTVEFDFDGVRDRVTALERTTDSSESRHVLEFLRMLVDDVEYDNYHPDEQREALLQQMKGSLEELEYAVAAYKQRIGEIVDGMDPNVCAKAQEE